MHPLSLGTTILQMWWNAITGPKQDRGRVSPKEKPRPHRPSPRRLIIRFALACALTFGFEQWLHHSIESSGQSHNVLTQGIFEIATFYHRLVTASPRKPVPRFTSLVSLSANDSPPGVSMLNVCRQRLFLAELIKSLSTARPNVIVIDKYFGEGTCPGDDPGTRNFIEALQIVCRNQTPMVVGRRVDEQSRERTPVPSLYLLDAALSLNPPAGCVSEGIANTYPDLRRAVLWWPNVQPVANSNQPPPSLALAAALAASPNLLAAGRLAGWTADAPPPYVSLLEESQFSPWKIAARDAVCGSPSPPGWRACLEGEMNPRVQRLVHSRIVVIGEDMPGLDRHDTVVGNVSGYILQADYIESLLDDRLIRPVPEAVNLIYGLIIYAMFEYILWYHHHRRFRGFLWVCALLLGAALTVYLSVMLVGYYLNPAMVSFLAVLIRLTDLILWPSDVPNTGAGV